MSISKNVNKAFGFDILYLYESARELGGTIYKIACEGGLLQAVDYMDIQMDEELFGEKLLLENIELMEDDGRYPLWTDDCCYIGDGNNKGWVCHKSTGSEMVKPDVFAVRQAMNVYYAEQMIRKTIDPRFFIERIDFDDETILGNISELLTQTLPKNWLRGFLQGELTVNYRILAYQIGYIRHYYPKVYAAIWEQPYIPDYKNEDLPFEKEHLSANMGIAVGKSYSYTSSYTEEQEHYTLYALSPTEAADNLRHRFGGSGDLMRAGRACSKMGLILRQMKECYSVTRGPELKQIRICNMQQRPNTDDIIVQVNERITELGIDESAPNIDQVDLLAFQELELIKYLYTEGTEGLIVKAAELAKMKNVQMEYNLSRPIAEYYQQDERYRLADQETAYVFYLDEEGFQAGLVCSRDGKMNVDAESVFNCDLIRQLDERIYEEMVKLIQPSLDIFGIKADDEDMRELRQDVGRIKRQLMRNDHAVVMFNNGWLSLSEKLPRSVYESALEDLLMECVKALKHLVATDDPVATIRAKGVKKLYLAGNLADDPYIWKRLGEGIFDGATEVAMNGALGTVLTNGLCLY